MLECGGLDGATPPPPPGYGKEQGSGCTCRPRRLPLLPSEPLERQDHLRCVVTAGAGPGRRTASGKGRGMPLGQSTATRAGVAWLVQACMQAGCQRGRRAAAHTAHTTQPCAGRPAAAPVLIGSRVQLEADTP